MKNINEHTTSELLTMMLDGELRGVHEAELFADLANSSELQSQMEHQLAVKEAVKSDVEAFTPPLEATNAIFSQLGYTLPPGVPYLASVWDKIFNRKVAVTAVLLIMGTFAVASYSYFSSNDHNDSTLNSQKNVLAIADESNYPSVPTTYDPVASNLPNNNIKSIPISSSRSSETFIKENSNQEILHQENNDIVADLSDKRVEKYNNVFANSINTSNYYSNLMTFNQVEYLNNSQFEILRSRINYKSYNGNEINKLRFANSIYFRGALNSNATAFDGGLNNIVIGYFRNWKENFSFGVEFGKEEITRLFTDDFSNQLISADKNVIWGAITLKYEAKSINFAGVSPFAQARLGFGSDFNLMMGFNTGAIWNISTLPVSLSASYEFNNFQYTHISQSYNFNKSGFNFGLHYNF